MAQVVQEAVLGKLAGAELHNFPDVVLGNGADVGVVAAYVLHEDVECLLVAGGLLGACGLFHHFVAQSQDHRHVHIDIDLVAVLNLFQ